MYLPVECIHYAPYGELLAIKHNGNYREKYLFTGKERDEETGLDYFGARYYDSRLGFWLSVDPLADKNIVNSPYAYCSGNPIMMIDPDGRDEYEFDSRGNLVGKPIPNSKADIIRYVREDGSKVPDFSEATFAPGTIFYENRDGNTILSIKGDENGDKAFRCLAQNGILVEWSQLKTGGDENGWNYLCTSHKKSSEGAAKTLLTPNRDFTKLREIIHSHPMNNPEPSGLTTKGDRVAGSWGDMGFMRGVRSQWWSSSLKFKIYLPMKDEYVDYTNRIIK